MWYYDEHGNFVGDEDRPCEDDMGWIASTTRRLDPVFVHGIKCPDCGSTTTTLYPVDEEGHKTLYCDDCKREEHYSSNLANQDDRLEGLMEHNESIGEAQDEIADERGHFNTGR